jgi:hypothetical protein
MRLRPGDAAELLAKREMERAGFIVHRTLVTVRIIQGRYAPSGADLFTLFDLVGLRDDLTLWAQVKTRRQDQEPSSEWLTRLAALPEPPATRSLWLWLDGFGIWQATRYSPYGRSVAFAWPPMEAGAA